MKKHINLYGAYLDNQKGTRIRSRSWSYLVVLLILGSIIGVYGTKLMVEKSTLNQQIKELSNYVTNTSNQETVQKAEATQQDIKSMSQLNDALDNIIAVFDEKQSISGDMIQKITTVTPSGVILNNIGFNGAVISLTISSTSNDGPAKFVDNILALDFVGGLK